MKTPFGKTMLYMSVLALGASEVTGNPKLIHGHEMYSKSITPEGSPDDKKDVAAFEEQLKEAFEAGWHLTTSAAMDAVEDEDEGAQGSVDKTIEEADKMISEQGKTIEALEGKIANLQESVTTLQKERDEARDEVKALKSSPPAKAADTKAAKKKA